MRGMAPLLELAKDKQEHTIKDAYKELADQLALELLSSLYGVSPSYFKRIVVQLLIAIEELPLISHGRFLKITKQNQYGAT